MPARGPVRTSAPTLPGTRNADEGTRRMNSIAARTSTSSMQPLSAPPAPAASNAASSGQGGDLLAAMNPAMDAAFAVGRPMDKQGAAAILATTGAYIAGANATIDKLDQGIERREKELAQLRISDPDAATDKEASLELLKKLRDRIQLSIERVSRTAAGDTDGDGGDAASEDDLAVTKSTARTADERARLRREQEELLEQRRLLLAPTTIANHTDSSTVAGTYAATTAARTS